jgi:hypothetical protein
MNNFAELSNGDSAKFLVRWRGRQEGPYLASVIEAKLAANEIGLLHEIFYDGKWVTIRDYTTERETILRAENEARQEQERRAREDAERQAKELENQRQSELLAEERRRTAHLEVLQSKSQHELPAIHPAAYCFHAHHRCAERRTAPRQSRSGRLEAHTGADCQA